MLPEGEERVYVDDRTGHTYVVTDDSDGSEAEAGSNGHGGRLSRRLGDNMAWLDGLSDEQYNEYMASTWYIHGDLIVVVVLPAAKSPGNKSPEAALFTDHNGGT